jgi:hypothetical protein
MVSVVFARNLHDLLMAAPAGLRATMGLDPGLRTGVKVAAHSAHQLGFEMHQDFDPPGPTDDAFTPAVRRGVASCSSL